MTRQVKVRWVLAAMAMAPSISIAAGQADQSVAFIHANVVPMDSERIIADQTVIIQEGRIRAIGPVDSTPIPEAAVCIDGTGKYLMPGLADMHVHFIGEEDHLALFIANGVTTVRNMFGSPEHLEWRERTKNGSLLGPTIYTTGPITDGDPPYWPGSAVVTTVEEAEKEVLAQKEAGYDGIKVFDNLQPDVYEAILATAAKHDFPVYGHVPARVGMERALGMGQNSFEHMNDFLYALIPSDDPVRVGLLEAAEDKTKVTLQTVLIQPFKSADANRIPQLVAEFVKSRAWLCPTLQLLQNMGSTAEEFQAIRKQPGMRYVAPVNWTYWDRVETGLTSEQADPAVLKDAYKLALRSIAAMHDAGARIVAGTDTPNPFLVPGFSLHQELQRLIDAGLTPYDALKAATRDAAELVDALDEFGTVAVGKRADMILVEANPLDDTANAAKQVGVMVRGRWYPKSELQAKLHALAEKYERQGALAARVTAIEHVTVVPMDSERVLEDQTVVVRGERIDTIKPAASATVPASAARIDGHGKYLMPGLADMHVHLARDEEADPDALVVFLAAGVTTVRNMWGRPVHLEWRKRIKDGDLLGPNIYSTGPITDGDPPFWAGSAVVRTPEEASKEVVAQKRAGYDGIKVFTNLSPASYYAILEAAKENDLPVYGHVPIRVGLEKALTSGQKSFEHMTDFTYAMLPADSPVLARLIDMFADRSKRNWRGFMLDPREQADRSDIPDLAAKAAAAAVWFCPTLVVHRHQAVDTAEFDRLRKDPGFAYVPPQKLNGWERRAQFLTKDDRNDPSIMKHGFDTILIAVKALHDAGAHLIVGTDTPNPFAVPGFSVHKELKYFVDAGLTPYEAIKAATHDSAEFVDALDEWGTVSMGRRADLMLVDANPLDDVSNASKQVGVMVRGRWYPTAELQAKLDALAEKYAEQRSEQAHEDATKPKPNEKGSR